MPVLSTSEFLAALRQDQLLPAAQLDAAEQEAGEARDADDLARRLIERGWLTAYQRDQILAGQAARLLLGDYRLLEPIGEGGMGTVFKARHARLNRLAALKWIRPELVALHPDILRRFEREAQAVAQLNHPNVVVLYDAGEVGGVHYLAMEYVEGVDLEKMVFERGPLPIEQACDYARQVAEGLHHASEAGLVHRDIKPSNLLVTRPAGSGPRRRPASVLPRPSLAALARGLPPEQMQAPAPQPRGVGSAPWGVVKILDMGLARLTELDDPHTSQTLTRQGTVLGTPDFMAPEQARDASGVDVRADLYSLGCTLYFLLTGRTPFLDAFTAVDKMLRHQTSRPLSVLAMRPQAPPAVVAVVERLMAKDPAERYQTPADLVEELTRIAHAAVAPAARTPLPRPVLGVSEAMPGDVPTVRAQASEPTPTHPRPLDTLVLPARKVASLEGHRGMVTAVAFLPGGQLLATGGMDDRVRLWSLGGGRPVERGCLHGQLGEVQALAFAPREPYLVTGPSGSGGRMWRWDFLEKGARERSPVPDGAGGVVALAFAPTGRMLAAGTDRAVVVWDATAQGLTRHDTVKLPEGVAKALAFSPDARLLAAGADCAVRLWLFGRWRTNQRAALAGHADLVNALTFSLDGKLLASASSDRTVRLWDPLGGPDPVATLTGHTNAVRAVRFLPGGGRLASVADGGQVLLWDVARRARLREWRLDRSMPTCLSLTGDGHRLAAGFSDGTVTLYDLELASHRTAAATRVTRV
jgi:serine/threonine-protein kinase